MTTSYNFIFRSAQREDMKAVRDMIQTANVESRVRAARRQLATADFDTPTQEEYTDLADFEKMSDGPKINEADLARDSGLDGGNEYCHIYVLEIKKQEKLSPLIIGYSICFFSYSTWLGKTYFMEDLYVQPDYRGLGAGACMFREVAAKAKQYNCKRMDFHVLTWNPACEFYRKMGALDLTVAEEWHFFRLQEQQITQLTQELL